MVTRHSSKRRQQPRPRTAAKGGTARRSSRPSAGSDFISERATAAIEAQRRRLQIAESILSCLITALEYSAETPRRQRPYYPDVAQRVYRMLNRAIDQLDRVNLKRAIVAAQQG